MRPPAGIASSSTAYRAPQAGQVTRIIASRRSGEIALLAFL